MQHNDWRISCKRPPAVHEPTFHWAATYDAPVTRGALFVLSLFIIGMPGAEFIAQLDEGSFATHVIRTTNICSISDRGSASQSREQFATDLPPGEQKPAQTTIESVESIFA